MKKLILIFIAVIGFTPQPLVFAQEVDVEDLVYTAENYPPANYFENGQLKGASVEILRLVWSKMGYPEQPIQVLPWARGYKLAQTEPNHVLFSMSRTKEREHLFQWVGPIFTARHVLVGLADRKDLQINALADAKQYKIGTIRKDIGEIALLNAGFDRKKLESVASLEQNVKKLIRGRIDFMCQSEAAIRKLSKIFQYDQKLFKTYYVVNEIRNYYAFHKGIPFELIQRIQNAFDQLQDERAAILQKYDMGL